MNLSSDRCDALPGGVAPATVADIERAAALPWLNAIKPDDLRLPFPVGVDLAAWLRSEARCAQPSQEACRTAAVILRADDRTFAQEVADAAVAAADARIAGKSRKGKVQQWVEMFVKRYVAPDGPGRSVSQLAEMFQVSGERIRQVCERMLQELRGDRFTLPATMRVLELAQRAGPCTISELNAQLRPHLGDGAGIEAAIHFAREMGLTEIPVEVVSTPVRVGSDIVRIATVQPVGGTPWSEAIFRLAQHDVSFIGCTSVLRLAGRLALEHGVALSRQRLLSLMQAAPGFTMLDEAGGWFTYGDRGRGSPLATRVRKIMAVARESVRVDEIAAALITDDHWMPRDKEHECSMPAMNVLHALLRSWDWLEQRGYNRFVAREAVPLDVLSESERLAVQVIQAGGGIATSGRINDTLAAKLHVGVEWVSGMLNSSPIFVRFEQALYGVIGQRVSETALAAARQERRGRRSPQVPTAPAGGQPDPDGEGATGEEDGL